MITRVDDVTRYAAAHKLSLDQAYRELMARRALADDLNHWQARYWKARIAATEKRPWHI